MVKGLETTYLDKDIIQMVDAQLKNVISENNLDIYILGYYLHGSRVYGKPSKLSDLDVVVEYKGNIKEYVLFNLFNDDENGFSIDGIKVDINPIRAEETGTLDEYKQKDKEYIATEYLKGLDRRDIMKLGYTVTLDGLVYKDGQFITDISQKNYYDKN